jgi:hypothetical protein
MMTALARIHGGKTALTTLDDRSGSGTPFTATATITAGTSTPATITAAGFVHDPYAVAAARNRRKDKAKWQDEVLKLSLKGGGERLCYLGLAVEGDDGAVAEGHGGAAGGGGRAGPDPEAAEGGLGLEGEERPEAVLRLDGPDLEPVAAGAHQGRPEDGDRAGASPVEPHLHRRAVARARRWLE